ncbi:MAG: hypothetical protein MUE60_10265 [Candidatus Eisenbacteria bacterium]|jgi:hypothetical protein|nr:hypothetical protein [Candidatus Eisenbacteria bacterium]
MIRRLSRPLVIILGSLAIAQFFVPHQASRWVEARLLDWLVLLESAALVAGILALARRHAARISRGEGPERALAAVTLGAMAFMLATGLALGTGPGSAFGAIYLSVLQPIQASMMSLLGFFMASAVFRSFRLTSAPATILLVSALTVLLARVPLGEHLVPRISMFSTWIIRGPNVAATRGLWIGIGLAACATGFRVILGIQGPTGAKRS